MNCAGNGARKNELRLRGRRTHAHQLVARQSCRLSQQSLVLRPLGYRLQGVYARVAHQQV
eukprot:2149097-Pyramimonas_sp.AAC.1